jgi:hypothetical protein
LQSARKISKKRAKVLALLRDAEKQNTKKAKRKKKHEIRKKKK